MYTVQAFQEIKTFTVQAFQEIMLFVLFVLVVLFVLFVFQYFDMFCSAILCYTLQEGPGLAWPFRDVTVSEQCL